MNRLHRTSCFNLVARLWLIFNSRENQAHVEETSRTVLHVNVDIKISFAINHFTSYMRNMKKRRKQKKNDLKSQTLHVLYQHRFCRRTHRNIKRNESALKCSHINQLQQNKQLTSKFPLISESFYPESIRC